ncbi:MAG: hypothetical protein LBH60_01925 [Prevotellaceae bacterium]|jgi:hypothetical protein|nr:hypothetical protein [Prevotellaceae bacterium]
MKNDISFLLFPLPRQAGSLPASGLLRELGLEHRYDRLNGALFGSRRNRTEYVFF